MALLRLQSLPLVPQPRAHHELAVPTQHRTGSLQIGASQAGAGKHQSI